MWMLVALACLLPPVPGAVVAGFAPQGGYGGHWGIDLAAIEGAGVRAPLSGVVSFAGSVAGMQTVTVKSGEVKVSLSYLSAVASSTGERVARGQVVGRSGRAHGRGAVHMSVRINDSYTDPAPLLACRWGPISDALRLVPYPGAGANRTSRWNLRSPSFGAPAYG
ncbi:MAG: M23 family metallopeptidase [Acidimicrobiia bacterium]